MAKTRGKRRWLRWTVGVLAVLLAVGLGLAAWMLLFFPNRIATRVAVNKAASYGFYVHIGSLNVDPLKASIEVTDFELDAMTNHEAGLPSLLTVGHYASQAKLRPLLRQERLYVESVEVDRPHVHVETRDEISNVDRFTEALDALALQLGATPEPSPTPPPTDLGERLEAERDGIRETFAGLPLPVQVDYARTTGAGFTIIDEGKTVLDVRGFGATTQVAFDTDGSGTIDAKLEPADRITFALHVPDLSVTGEIVPDAQLDTTLWDDGAFRGAFKLENATVRTAEITERTSGVASAHGAFDARTGDVVLDAFELRGADFFTARGDFRATELGTKSIAATWSLSLVADRVPQWATAYVTTLLEADAVTLGGELTGTMTGRLVSSDPDEITAALEARKLPLFASIRAEARTGDHILTMGDLTVGGLGLQSTIEIEPESVSLASQVQMRKVRHTALGSRPVAVDLDSALVLGGALDDLEAKKLVVKIPAKGLRLGGSGHIEGVTTAALKYLEASDAGVSTELAAMRALDATRDVSLAGNIMLNAPKKLEVVPGVELQGMMYASAELQRGGSPRTRLKASLAFDQFATYVSKEIADVELEGLTAQLEMNKSFVLGGKQLARAAQEADLLAEVEDAITEFDPAERGYYGRLAPYRINRENVKIRKLRYENYVIDDFVADVAYDGEALRASYFRMNLAGGEVVGRAYARPSVEGIRLAFFSDFAGVDVAPILREKPPETAGDASRINGSTAANVFLPLDDPVSGIAQASARVDLTAAGSEVINEILLFLDPEQKEPTYNLVRDLTRRVKGLGRPEMNIVLDKGFYDVNIGFPTLGVAKEVRRIPLGQTLALKYSRDLLDEYLPDPELLRLASVVGVDGEAKLVYLQE